MTKVAIHQPHYFPWMGYLDKMAKVDKFILLDEVQIEKGSNMYRNKVATWDGKEKYLTVGYEKEGCLKRSFNQILIDDSIEWQKRQCDFIWNNYRKAEHFSEIWKVIEEIFDKKYLYLFDVLNDSIEIEKKLFGIDTEIILQSDVQHERDTYKNDLLISLCKAVGAEKYLSGNGAKKYMNVEMFEKSDIAVEYQNFKYPSYKQFEKFIPNLSALDILFHCGQEKAKKIFWENVEKSAEEK